jgi:hypothetical protein
MPHSVLQNMDSEWPKDILFAHLAAILPGRARPPASLFGKPVSSTTHGTTGFFLQHGRNARFQTPFENGLIAPGIIATTWCSDWCTRWTVSPTRRAAMGSTRFRSPGRSKPVQQFFNGTYGSIYRAASARRSITGVRRGAWLPAAPWRLALPPSYCFSRFLYRDTAAATTPGHRLPELFAFLGIHLLPTVTHPALPAYAVAGTPAKSSEKDFAQDENA